MFKLKFKAYLKEEDKTVDVSSIEFDKGITYLEKRFYADIYKYAPINDVILMQYTGVNDYKKTDKFPQGEPIYEGNIVKLWDFHNKEYLYKATISRSFGVIFVSIDDQKGKWYPYNDKYIRYEVIGNIYENCNLLKI